jgi:branched-chain amino acid aminotransferase
MTTITDETSAPAAQVGHGEAFTDHMYSLRWSPDRGWHDPELLALEQLSLHPATIGLHYGQAIFEGLKAFRQADGGIAVFRPDRNAARFRRSAARMAMPELPEELFLGAIDAFVAADGGQLADDPSLSLYLRPMMLATDVSLMLRPSDGYRFLLMAFVSGGFFDHDVRSISVYVNRSHGRAMPGGTGDVKVAGNYAPTFPAHREAQQAGCHQVLWLDSAELRWLDEMSGMTLCLVRGSGADAELVTPPLGGTILPSVTRDSVLTLAECIGVKASEERISLEQWRKQSADGLFTEAFACGTAAAVTPIGRVDDGAGEGWRIGDGEMGPVTRAMRQALFDVQHGITADPGGWLRRVS